MDKLTWTDFKSFVTSRSVSLQWREDEACYYLSAFDGQAAKECRIYKMEAVDAAALTDFEANYKAGGNARLGPVVLKPFADADGFRARFKGISGIAAFGVTTNLDYVLTEERWIDGVEIIHIGAAQGDTVNFQIVHPTYGVVDEFGSSWNIDSTVGKQGAVVLSYPAKLIAGLTIRCAYISVGIANVWVGINLRLHKKT